MTKKTKVCVDCKKRKPLDDFYRVHRGDESRQARCKLCDNAKRTAGCRAGSGVARGRIIVVRQVDGTLALARVLKAGVTAPATR